MRSNTIDEALYGRKYQGLLEKRPCNCTEIAVIGGNKELFGFSCDSTGGNDPDPSGGGSGIIDAVDIFDAQSQLNRLKAGSTWACSLDDAAF